MEPVLSQPVVPQGANPSPSPSPSPQLPMTQPVPAVAGKPGGNRKVLLILVIAGMVIVTGAVAIGFLLVSGQSPSRAPLPKVAVPTAAPTTQTTTVTPTPVGSDENPFATTPTPVANPFEQTVTNPFEGL